MFQLMYGQRRDEQYTGVLNHHLLVHCIKKEFLQMPRISWPGNPLSEGALACGYPLKALHKALPNDAPKPNTKINKETLTL